MGSHDWGDQGPAQLQPDPRRQNPAQGKACHRHHEPPPHRCGMETIPQELFRFPVLDCRAAVRKRGHCSEEKGTLHPHLFPAHKVLPCLQRAVPCTKPCFCQDPLSGEQPLHYQAVFPLLSTLQLLPAGPRLGQATPSCSISVLATAAAALKDTDLSGSFIRVLTNDWIDLTYRRKD